jgi:hypothetical protein
MTAVQPVTASTPAGPYTRFRAQYAKLPPGVQMIGLQLWLPAVFIVAFVLCYINAFHQPQPHDVPVAVIGSGQQVESFAQQLETSSAGAFSVTVLPDLQEARAQVRVEDLAAAFVPGTATSDAQLVVSSGGQFQLATMVRQTFAAVATAEQAQLVVDDLAPLPAADSYGTAGFYLALVWIIAGYMVGMFVGMMGGSLGHEIRFGIIVGCGLLSSLLATVLAGPVVGAVHGHFLELWALGWGTACAVGFVVNGLAYFTGRFVTGAALVLFVFLNIPASGGAFPAAFVPSFFGALNPYVIGTGVIDVLRSVLYDAGPGVRSGARILITYALIGACLSLLGEVFATRRARRRAAQGKPGSMMHAARF